MAAKRKGKITPLFPPTPIGPFCVNSGSINVCMTVSDGYVYDVALYTTDPTNPNAASTHSPVLLSASGGSYCAQLPAGPGVPCSLWARWSCRSNGSTYTSGFSASLCSPTDLDGCAFCHKPAPAALHLQLGTRITAGSSSASEPVNRLTPLFHSQDHNFPCCWFSPPIDSADTSGNPAFWMLKKTANDTWYLCLRRVSHEVASYHLKTRNSHKFPIKLKRGRVSKDFKNWPLTITIKSVE